MTTCKKKLFSALKMTVTMLLLLSMSVTLLVSCNWFGGDKTTTSSSVVTPGGPEVGTYYYDSGVEEYTLILSDGNNFTLTVRGQTANGTYTLTDGKLTLDFAAEGKATVNATLANGVVTMTYEGATMRFLKKITYTVNFVVNGGSEIQSQSVLNGKTVAKPADPVRTGFVFIGWYTDSEFKTPFAFASQPVTGNITLYARWIEKAEGMTEYTVSFDANYENAENPADQTTVGGKLYGLPVIERTGYEFMGWWISMTENGDKLSYQYEEGTAIESDVTLYAMWQKTVVGDKISAPVVKITADNISWNSISGARSYKVTVTNGDGVVVIEQETPATTVNVSFAALDAGEYKIKVVAFANAGGENNSETTLYYSNKQLDKVTKFTVTDSWLSFEGVENAEKYLITVVCGNSDHQHTALDNGSSTTFNFANCVMTKDGIRFTVTAVAEGYISSTSKEYVHLLALDAVEGLYYDETTQQVHWNAVADAEYYMVSVKCGNAAHDHEFVNNGSETFVSLKYCDAVDGGIVVKVYPCTNGYASPEASQVIANKNVIATPTGIHINGMILTWDAVVGAAKYEVQIGTEIFEVNTNCLDIAAAIDWAEGVEYAISVRAIGETSSVFSDPVTACYNAFFGQPVYAKGHLTWTPVIGATVYEIQVNDGEITTITNGDTSAPITLTQNGNNTVKIRFSVASVYSEWTAIEVEAYTVTFDTVGGSNIPAQYKAEGDEVTLPSTNKNGYTFVAWYNVPGGPNANGMAYADKYVVGAGSATLYAYYTPVKYTVTYNYGIQGTGDKETDQVPFESHYQLIVPTPVNTTVAFGGWFTGPYGTGTQLTDSKGNSLAPWPVTEGGEVFAYWINEALSFIPTKINGKDVYMVSAGPRIALLEEVTVPATYNGLPVAMIAGNAFANCTNIKVINIPATLEQISIVDPFAGCSNLEAINVYAVEGSTTAHFWSEDGVLFDNGTGDIAQAKLVVMPMGKTGEYTVPDGITEIPEFAFANSKLTKITVSASVTYIGNNAFDSCKSLTAVVFAVGENDQPLTVGNNAFNECTALERITLPARLTSIALNKHTLYFEVDEEETNVEVIEENALHAFSGCTALTSIAVASGNKTYKAVDGVLYSADGTTLLYCPTNKTGAFAVPAGTQTIAPGAFVGCHGITEVILPNTLRLVGEAAFAGLEDGFEKITVRGNSLVSLVLDKYAFLACADLTEIVLEEGSHLTELGEGAFYGCENLTSITIPASMTKIGAEAFRECGSLTSVIFETSETPLAFGERVFFACDELASISLPANVTEIPGIFLGCDALEEVKVDPLNPYITSVEGVLFNKAMTELLYYPVAKSGDYTIPATVKKIAPSAFAYNENIGALTVYTTLEVIGEHAFDSAEIVSIAFVDHGELPAAESLIISDYAFANTHFGTGTGTKTADLILPNNTKSIGRFAFFKTYFNKFSWGTGIETISPYAFYNNTYLGRYSDVVIPESVTEIGEYTFYKCTYLGRYSAVVLHNKLTRIGDYAFYGCNDTYFTTIEIPASVTEIGAYAFCNASKLATVTFAEGSRLTKIGAHAFDKTVIKEITIPASVTDIGAYAFANNNKMETVIFAESEDEANAPGLILGSEYIYEKTDEYGITSIVIERGHVFGDSTTNKLMKNVVLPARLVEIGEYSFYKAGASGATVTLPANSRLQVIGAHAFDQSLFTGELVLPATLQNMTPVSDSSMPYDRLAIGAYAFNRSKFTKITFAAGGTAPVTIGEFAFAGSTELVEITLPARLAEYISYTGDVIEALQGGAKIFGAEGTVSDACGKLTSIKVEEAANALYAGIGGILYKTDGNVPCELILCPISNSQAVTVPATVTKIWDLAFYNCASIPSITFEGGNDDMMIGNKAFYGCSAITAVTLPDNVVSIGSQAFAYCSGLTEITLPANLLSFDATTVSNCSALANIYVGNNNQGVNYTSIDGILYTADLMSLMFYPPKHNAEIFTIPGTVTVIGANTFAGNSFLKEVVLGEGVVEIRDGAFSSSSITKITIPTSVSLIGENAFNACRSLTEVVFTPEGTTPLVIGNRAFYLASNLTSIAFPARLVAIGNEAFAQSSISGGLTSVTFAQGSRLLTIGDMAFSKTKLEKVTLPAGMVSIGNKVFYECANLVNVSFGEGLESIGDQTFGYCTKLEEVNFPASMRTMGVNTFFAGTGSTATCKSLKKVTFGVNSQLESIPAGTFAYSGLTEIVIPASVKTIEFFDHENRTTTSGVTGSGSLAVGAFDNCKSLTSVTFESGAQCVTIGAFAFYQCSALNVLEIAPSVSTIGTQAFYQCNALAVLTVPASCTNFGKQAFASCTGLTTVVMDSKATALSESMFDGCTNLASINIPGTVSSIGSNCFKNTAIVEITIPASVTDLSATGIFYGCKSLVKVTINGTATVLGENMFYGCSSLAEVKLSDSIEVLSPGTFEDCTALSTITLPASVKTLESAFVGSGLAEFVVEAGNTSYVAIDGVLFDIGKTKIVAYPANKTSPTFTIPKEVIEISPYTFQDITALQEIIFEQGGMAELRILDNAFDGCTGIRSIVFPERLVYIGKKAFYDCKNLVSVVLPSTLEEIDTDAFRNCNILEVGNFSSIALTLGDTTKNGYVMNKAIYLYNAEGGTFKMGTAEPISVPGAGKALVISNGIATLPVGEQLWLVAYIGTANAVVIPEGVTHIGDKVFDGNKTIVKVAIPTTVIYIGNQAFYGATNLAEVNLPDSIEYIGGQAFYNCSAITTKHNLPASLKTIGERAFYQSTILNTTLVMPDGVTTVGYRAFGGNAITTFYIKATQQPAGYDSAWAWKSGTENHIALWGFTGEDITYTFTEQVADGEEATVYSTVTSGMPIQMPENPTKNGYVFMGWVDEDGNKITGSYYSSTKTTLYAVWMTQEEFDTLVAGTSREYAIEAVNGASHTIVDNDTGVKGTIYFKVTATEDVTLTITTKSGFDTVIRIYDSISASSSQYKVNNDKDNGENGKDEVCTYTFTAGTTYYIDAYIYSASNNGTLTVTVTVD